MAGRVYRYHGSDHVATEKVKIFNEALVAAPGDVLGPNEVFVCSDRAYLESLCWENVPKSQVMWLDKYGRVVSEHSDISFGDRHVNLNFLHFS